VRYLSLLLDLDLLVEGALLTLPRLESLSESDWEEGAGEGEEMLKGDRHLLLPLGAEPALVGEDGLGIGKLPPPLLLHGYKGAALLVGRMGRFGRPLF
jgi:hypothetical protein